LVRDVRAFFGLGLGGLKSRKRRKGSEETQQQGRKEEKKRRQRKEPVRPGLSKNYVFMKAI